MANQLQMLRRMPMPAFNFTTCLRRNERPSSLALLDRIMRNCGYLFHFQILQLLQLSRKKRVKMLLQWTQQQQLRQMQRLPHIDAKPTSLKILN